MKKAFIKDRVKNLTIAVAPTPVKTIKAMNGKICIGTVCIFQNSLGEYYYHIKGRNKKKLVYAETFKSIAGVYKNLRAAAPVMACAAKMI